MNDQWNEREINVYESGDMVFLSIESLHEEDDDHAFVYLTPELACRLAKKLEKAAGKTE